MYMMWLVERESLEPWIPIWVYLVRIQGEWFEHFLNTVDSTIHSKRYLRNIEKENYNNGHFNSRNLNLADIFIQMKNLKLV